MNILLQEKIDSSLPSVIALFQHSSIHTLPLSPHLTSLLKTHLSQKIVKGEKDEVISTHDLEGKKVQKLIFFGLGTKKDLTPHQARNLGAKLIRTAKSFKSDEINVVIPQGLQPHLSAFIEGLVLGHYDPEIHKTGKEREKKQESIIKKINIIGRSWARDHHEMLKKAQLISQVVNFIRDLVNCGPRDLNTPEFVKEIKRVAKENQYRFIDFDKKQLEEMGMGGLLAVNRGSEDPAHLMVLEYQGAAEDPIVITGKGVIFDTGGISLKPSEILHEMQLDMGGAGVVLGTFMLLKKLEIKRHVIGIIPITDNAIGNKAYRPSEIIKTYSGKTVEIVNTDAEGRLILCDALHYGATKYKPRYLIDFATLTGACMVALGFRTAGLFGNEKGILKKIEESAERTDEPVCRLPITDADEEAVKGKIADLKNLHQDHPYGGACRAAAFLKNFVGESKWAHLDIAGTAFTKNPKDYEVSMATGYGVRLMVDFLEKMSN